MNFRKTLITGLTVVAILAPAGIASASVGDASSGSQTSDTSTTVPSRRDVARAKKFREDMKTWQEATRAWLNGRATAIKSHRDAVAAASSSLKTALTAATTKAARKSAMEAYKAAREQAKTDLDAALAALGNRPVRPTK